MTYNPENISYKIHPKLQKLTRDARKSVNNNYLTRKYRAFKWKRENNQAYQDWTDILIYWAWLGILAGAAAAVSIVEYLYPWL